MIRAYQLILLVLSAGLAACSDAKASLPDPTRDADCSVLAFYFHRQAAESEAPSHQKHAARVVHEWYAARIRKMAVEARWSGMDDFNREIGPILEAVKRDPMAMTDRYLQCTERAASDPGFDRFAARWAR
jgi:hypothetical protein